MDQSFREQMRRFGLTEKEVQTYIAILEERSATATEIADRTDVSKRHVYNIAQKLEERELVIINDYLNPTLLEPAPPDRVYQRLRDEAEEMYRELEAQYQSGQDEEASIKVLKSRTTVVNKIQNLVSSAEDRVAISIPADFVPTLRETLQDAVDDGVTVLLLLFENPVGTSMEPDISLDGLAHVIRYRDNEVPVLLAIDRKYALISPRGVITQPNSQVNAISMGKSYLESVVFNALMNSSWIIADEIYTKSPEPLPNRYTNFRQAVINAAIHDRDGTDLSITAEARPSSEAGHITEMTGKVVDIKQRLVEPANDASPGQCCLHVDTGSEIITIGGKDAQLEDYSAYSTALEEVK